MTTEAQKKASLKYCRANTLPITLRLNRKTDADLIEWLENEPNKSQAIKEALRKITLCTRPSE